MKRAPIKQMSAKRRAEKPLRDAVVDEVLTRDNWVCRGRAFFTNPCEGVLDAHEVVQRSIRPGSHLEPELCITVCRAHHEEIHRDISYSHHVGLLRHSWDVDEHGHLKPLDGAA